MYVILTYRYRVKNLSGTLRKQARTVNFIWNYLNETQKSCLRLGKKWPTAFDFINLTAGTSQELGILAENIGCVCQQYVKSRRQKKRPFLRFRSKKSLGWIPLKGRIISQRHNGIQVGGKLFKVYLSRMLPPMAQICDGSSFSEDSKGQWYLNLVIDLPDTEVREIKTAVGIDLGLKDFATFSNGEKIENPRHFRALEERLGKAQRANKKRLTKSVHLKICNVRKDFHHKLSTKIAKQFDWIAVGNVNSKGLKNTWLAKSVSDVGWSTFRNQLRYKAIAHGATFVEVNERFSTQTCSLCGCMPPERPRGIAGLGIRQWTCSDCGAVHDRDVNSARNILAGSGHRTLVEGALAS